ncbi:histidine phosphotransferase family protein [Amorphus coralli]|uniref:histidine phosphotransferase family protein n=1 Tax=Amorphus coralli TaxID=340680 RepID=UPI000379B446|nr:histidine phosphotransferase family protein [Amorphus coralli]
MSSEPSEELLGSLELASLLSSRICHDVVGPVGAIVNGLELLEGDDSPETRDVALQLIEKSATQASAALQFMRLAFGAGGSAGSMIDLADARTLLEAQFENERADLALTLPVAVAPRSQVKVLLNLAMFAVRAIPRGGTISANVEMVAEDRLNLSVVAEGPKVRLPDTTPFVLGEACDVPLDPHCVQPYLTGLLVRAAGLSVTARLEEDDGRFVLEVR